MSHHPENCTLPQILAVKISTDNRKKYGLIICVQKAVTVKYIHIVI